MILFPKLYTVEEDWERANSICNSDGGALISVLTEEDKSALSYYSNQEPKRLWVGLKKTENTSCWDGECDGKLRWQDGSQFVFDSLIHDGIKGNGTGNSYGNCFRWRNTQQKIDDYACSSKEKFICQIACPGKSIFIIHRVQLFNVGLYFLAAKFVFSCPSVKRFSKFLGGLMTLDQVKSVQNFC